MSGLDPSTKRTGTSEEKEGPSVEDNKEKPAPTDSSENSQTPSTPRFSFMIFITSHTHFLFATILIIAGHSLIIRADQGVPSPQREEVG